MGDSTEPTRDEKIADALRAAPAYIADAATVVDWDMTTVLREGSPDWICVPTPRGTPQSAPMCLDPTFLQWFMELEQGKRRRSIGSGSPTCSWEKSAQTSMIPWPRNPQRARIGTTRDRT